MRLKTVRYLQSAKQKLLTTYDIMSRKLYFQNKVRIQTFVNEQELSLFKSFVVEHLKPTCRERKVSPQSEEEDAEKELSRYINKHLG